VPAEERPSSIQALLELPEAQRLPYLDFLVPSELKTHYDLPATATWRHDDGGTFRWLAVPGAHALRVEVWPEPGAGDPAEIVELTDTYLGHMEAAWIVLNDVRQPRFQLDRSPNGSPLPLGSPDRNLREEIRALAAGMAPNQVRPGLRMFRPLIERIEGFAQLLGIGILFVAPLAYHNAVKYEKYGFTYASGREELEWIHREFLPGGLLRRRMDGTRPFRMPWMADTIRGRSWAIHDGVLNRRWMAPQMYKFVGRSFSTCTFPDAVW
jgi:hypothetical protein